MTTVGTRKSPLWRRTFLRALARTGTISVAAAEAGIEPETVHRHRCKDERFAEQCKAALAKGKANAEKLRARRRSQAAGELVLRRTRNGAKLVRATPGRWCQRVEDAFFAELGRTGSVKSAAAASALSAAAIYSRRKYYPDFAERWDAVEKEAVTGLPSLLRAASIASLDPAIESRGLPKVNVDQAIRIATIKAPGGGGRGADREAGNRNRKEKQSKEDLTAALLKSLKILKKRKVKEKLEAGWTETEEGHLIPPGWVKAELPAPPDADGGEGDAEAPRS